MGVSSRPVTHGTGERTGVDLGSKTSGKFDDKSVSSSPMVEPDFLICLACETPTYVFEYGETELKSALCQTCGNDERSEFMTELEFEQED